MGIRWRSCPRIGRGPEGSEDKGGVTFHPLRSGDSIFDKDHGLRSIPARGWNRLEEKMPITYRIEITFECDKCLKQTIYDQIDLPSVRRVTKRALVALGIKDGWQRKGNECFCSDCKTR